MFNLKLKELLKSSKTTGRDVNDKHATNHRTTDDRNRVSDEGMQIHLIRK